MWEQSTMAIFDDDESLQRRTSLNGPALPLWALRGGTCPPRFLGGCTAVDAASRESVD